jgi:excisionase family DNA binding protein
MGQLLTTKQIQELLKIDRVTVYRMLNDGRLKGVKVGNQWRFFESEIDRLMGEEKEKPEETSDKEPVTDFPAHCVQMVQEIFAGIIGIGAITVSLKGTPLTEPDNGNPFCKLMLSSPVGREACQNSWRSIALRTSGSPPFQVCHAGLGYMRSVVQMNDQPTAWLIAGQFYLTPPDPEKERAWLEQLAEKYDLPQESLSEAAKKIPVLKRSQQEQVQEWTPKVARTVQSILSERADLTDRLQRIAELSAFQSTLFKLS